MKKMLLAAVAVISSAMAYGGASGESPRVPPVVPPAAAGRVFLEDYCTTCHNDDLKVGNFSLIHADPADPAPHADQWEKVLLKLGAGMMPPAGMPRPDRGEVGAFLADVEEEIDLAATFNPNPGRPILHRLNRTEYANSIRDLLGLAVDVSSLLPTDDMSQGYDNMSDVLTISPTLLEGYMRAAGKISRLAVGDRGASPVVETYVLPQAFSQLQHVEGAPFGTRGGIVLDHNFPADGEYVFRISFYYASIGALFGDNKPAEGEQIEVSVNGERVALLDIDRKMKDTDDLRTPPVRVKAGPQTISAAFIERAAGPVQDFVMPFERALADLSTGHIPGMTGLPHLRDLGISGPSNVTGVSDTESRRKIFVCRPQNASEELPCVRDILSRLARQAFRRPVTDGDLKNLLNLYASGRKQRDFDSGITVALQAILADPEFLFRFERAPRDVAPGENYRVSDLELASRLSFFLWASAPDDELLTAASQGKLKDPAVLEQQTRRMLADPRSETLATNFASHWLHLQNLKEVHPDVYLYPDWDYNLTQSMRRETELFFDSIVREDRSVVDLVTADYTFVDGRLASHYGIPNVVGNRFRRVKIADENRRGLLGHGSILTLTSLANRTSPVIRGQWIMAVLLGAPPPKPPASVPPLKENTAGAKLVTVRERLLQHRADPVCAACHNIMDPIGFSLENFDPVGAWRAKDSGLDIDPSGTLFDGTEVKGPVDLRAYVLRSKALFVRNFTQNLLMYALGRVVQHYDMPTVRSIVRDADASDNRFSSLVLGIVKSAPFQLRRMEETNLVTSPAASGQDAGRR